MMSEVSHCTFNRDDIVVSVFQVDPENSAWGRWEAGNKKLSDWRYTSYCSPKTCVMSIPAVAPRLN